MADFGEVDKLFYVYGERANSAVDKFVTQGGSRFYKGMKTEDPYACHFIVVDASEANRDDFFYWLNKFPENFWARVFLVNDTVNKPSYSHIHSVLSSKFGEHLIMNIKNHEHLQCVLESLCELQNGFSVMSADVPDFWEYLRRGQHYWSDFISANSLQELTILTQQTLEAVKEKANNLGLNLTYLFGCIRKELKTYTMEEYEETIFAIRACEPFDKQQGEFLIHTNLKEKIFGDDIDKTEFHMLWMLSEQ